MKTRALVTTAVSILLLAATLAAGLNAVFTVTLVQAEFTVVSEEGEREADALKKSLDGFVGANLTFLDLKEIRSKVEEYPCMKVETLEKSFPSTVRVQIRERSEAFALERADGYAVLADDGTYLYDKTDLNNRTAGENILLYGFPDTFTDGRASGEVYEALFRAYAVFAEELGTPRANILSVAYERGYLFDLFTFRMREGIRIEIGGAREFTAEKTRAALCDERYGYLVRTDRERLSGCISVAGDGQDTQVVYDITRN